MAVLLYEIRVGGRGSSWHICRLLRAQRMSVRLDAPSRWHIPALCNSGETGAFFIARFGEYAWRTCRPPFQVPRDITLCRGAPSTRRLNDARLLCELQYTYPWWENLLNWHQLRLRLLLCRSAQLEVLLLRFKLQIIFPVHVHNVSQSSV